MKKLLIPSIIAVLLSACASNPLMQETVKVDSKPAGAEVLVGGEVRGTTPCQISLDKGVPYTIVLKKAGYKDENFALATTEQNPFIKFGPLDDLGYYKELTPNPIDGKLMPDFLPATPGEKKFEGMSEAILKADALKKEGKISCEEYAVMQETIFEFYAPGVKQEVTKQMEEKAAAECEAKKACEAKKECPKAE